MTTPSAIEAHLQRELGRVVFGASVAIHALTIAAVARGHILFEGPPGLGKTLLSRTFAAVSGGEFKRIQGTADLMPSDITGVHVFNTETRRFEFQRGPVFADVLLVDEINRAGPKTQSALLEAMEEHQVTADRETFALAADFLVVATRNPREFEGTYPLPESQLDRFMLSFVLGYPARENEAEIISHYNLPGEDALTSPNLDVLPPGALFSARRELKNVQLSDELIAYVLDIAAAPRV
ncbi:MAG: AAA family ATPase [Proteobacteria bacterium]|nr:AAA family ATPase [Pseudomonadota bacterium]